MNKFLKQMVIGMCALTISGISFSKDIDAVALASNCEAIATELKELYVHGKHEPCADSVLYSSYVMSEAGGLAKSKRYQEVNKNLNIAYSHLNKTLHSFGKCPYLSPHSKPYVDKLWTMIDEIENSI